MLSIQIPSQSFGKSAGEHRSGYQIQLSAPELQPLITVIESSLRFQWLSQPERETDRYPAVWYFHPLDEQRGLLYYFEDKGADPRPHVLQRVVGLCLRGEHESFLTALASGKKPSQQINSKGLWKLSIKGAQSKATFPWKSQFLHRGDPATYDLSTRQSPLPAPSKTAPTSLLLSPPPSSRMKPLYTHLACLIIGIVITLLLYPRTERTAEVTPAEQISVSGEQVNEEIQLTYERMCTEVRHLQDSLTAMQQLSEGYRQSMERFKSMHADKLTTEQIHELTELIKKLHQPQR